MSIIQNGPSEFHANAVTYPPSKVLEDELDSYFSKEALIGDHFLVEYFSDILGMGVKPSRPTGFLERKSHEEVFEKFQMEEPFDTPDIWGFQSEGVEGDILDVIFSNSFQNLRGKSQQGPITHFLDRFSISRFEHSVDSLMILRMLGIKSEVELEPDLQIYTAVHDIGHGVGSHWSEMVVDAGWETHEERARRVLQKEGLWEGIETEYGDVFDREYDLMDASKPDISIDRLAYIIKDAWRMKGFEATFPKDFTENLPGEKPEEESFEWTDIGRFLDSVEIHEEGETRALVMGDEEAAADLARAYMDLEERLYFNAGYDAFNQGLADAARIALSNDSVSEEHLFSLPDDEFFSLVADQDPEAREHMDRVLQHFLYESGLERTDQDPDITVKVRRDRVDPKVKEYESQGLEEMKRASEYSRGLRETMNSHVSRDGEEVGFNVLEWDYPENEYSQDAEQIGVYCPEISRIIQAYAFSDRPFGDYWLEKLREYSGRGMRELGVPTP